MLQHHRQSLHFPIHSDEAFIHTLRQAIVTECEVMLTRTQLAGKNTRNLLAQQIYD
jgi:hypothetical protein